MLEIFKVWTALKVEQGTPYFIGQHGNEYGTNVWESNSKCPEQTTCDKFITWGWKEGENKIPAFVLTNAGRKPRQFDKAGSLLLIECPLIRIPHYHDNYHDYHVS